MAKTPPAAEMPFLDHLEELRIRILYMLGALVVGVLVSFVVLMRFDIVGLLARPILTFLEGQQLVYTNPSDPFNILLTAAIGLGILLALPVIVYQLWSFLAPALYEHEKRVVVPVTAGAVLLFLSGVSLSYFVVMPIALDWFRSFQTPALTPMITASAYFDFAISMSLAFGVCFELPIVVLALAALGIVTPATLGRYRRHALAGCVVVGALLTPGDMFWTTLAMAGPLYLLYELSVMLSVVVVRRRERRIAASTSPGAVA